MWIPPGKESNRNLWRYDVAQRSFLPPGVRGAPKGIQVEMPNGYQGTEPRGFHMLASPSGTQAPVEHINYTPETGEVHGRGSLAPIDKLNYTLMPEEAMQPMGMGHGSATGAVAQGMGAGAGAPALSAFGAPQAFAGTPPLASNPTMVGPNPSSAQASPQWGGGGTAFDTRMGMGNMGAGDDGDLFTNTDPTATNDPSVSNQASNPPAGQQQATPTATSSSQATAPINPQTGQPWVPNQAMPHYGTDGRVIAYEVYTGMNEYEVPQFKWINGDSTTKTTYQQRADGSYDVIDASKQPPTVTNVGTPDPTLVAKAQSAAEIDKLTIALKNSELKASQAKDANAAQLAQIELQKAQTDLATARAKADQAAVEAAQAGKPKPPSPSAEIVDKSGQVFRYNPDTDHYEATGIYKSAGQWTQYNDPVTQTIRLFNPETREDVELAPMDQYKEYPPQKGAGGKWIQWDPKTKSFKTVYQDDPEWATQWSGDELIAVDKNNPQNVKKIWTKTRTMAEDDAHTAAIDAHNNALLSIENTKLALQTGKISAAEAQIKIAQTMQDVLHPKPMQLNAGSFYVPPGLDVNVEDWDPATGQTSTRHISGGPLDPRVLESLNKAAGMLGQVDFSGVNPNVALEQQGKGRTDLSTGTVGGVATTTGGTTGGTTAGGTTQQGGGAANVNVNVGEQLAGQGVTGWPGRGDPHVSGSVQPDSYVLDKNGNKIFYGPSYGKTAQQAMEEARSVQPTSSAEEDQGQGEGEDWFFNEETGRKRDEFGAGAATDVGWTPRAPIGTPASGPGGGLGMPGAGAEAPVFYDPEGNPIDPEDLQKYKLNMLNWDEPWAQMSTGFSGGQEGGMGSPDSPAAGGPMGNLREHPPMREWNITPQGNNAGEVKPPPGGHGPGWGGEVKPPGPLINTGPGLPMGPNIFKPPVQLPGGHVPGPEVKLPNVTDEGTNWIPQLGSIVAQKVNESLKELLGWPKLEEVQEPPTQGAPNVPTGMQGGFDQPEVFPRNTETGQQFPPTEPTDEARPPGVKDITHVLGQGGTSAEELQNMQQEEGLGRAVGQGPIDENAQALMQRLRDVWNTMGTGADNDLPGWSPNEIGGGSLGVGYGSGFRGGTPGLQEIGEPWMAGMDPRSLPRLGPVQIDPMQAFGTGQDEGMMSPPGVAGPQVPPQGPGGEQPPAWLLTLLRNHPELLQQAGLPPLPGQSAGGPPTPPTPSAGWQPPSGATSPSPGVGAPSPGGAPMIPPLDTQDVAGIGHRFGQEMNVGEPQHSGVDLQALEGTPTKSPVDGFVERVEENPQGLGKTIIIRGMDGSEHRLGHLQDISAYPGMQVKMGQDLGSPVGDTGMTTGAHLHWGVRDGQGQPSDPTAALGPMAQMPPVPGTEMMGPPGGVGGGAQMGGGQEAGWRPRRRAAAWR